MRIFEKILMSHVLDKVQLVGDMHTGDNVTNYTINISLKWSTQNK